MKILKGMLLIVEGDYQVFGNLLTIGLHRNYFVPGIIIFLQIH